MITARLLREWHACWDDARIAVRLAGRPFVTLRTIANDTSLSFDDRLWVLCNAMCALDESACRLYAIESAMRATPHAGDEDDQALHAAILSELIEIEDRPEGERSAARDAIRNACWAAARDAAWGAAWSAARDAAWAAAWSAARDAAWAAAWAAARDAELDNAIARALEWLGDWTDAEEMP